MRTAVMAGAAVAVLAVSAGGIAIGRYAQQKASTAPKAKIVWVTREPDGSAFGILFNTGRTPLTDIELSVTDDVPTRSGGFDTGPATVSTKARWDRRGGGQVPKPLPAGEPWLALQKDGKHVTRVSLPAGHRWSFSITLPTDKFPAPVTLVGSDGSALPVEQEAPKL